MVSLSAVMMPVSHESDSQSGICQSARSENNTKGGVIAGASRVPAARRPWMTVQIGDGHPAASSAPGGPLCLTRS